MANDPDRLTPRPGAQDPTPTVPVVATAGVTRFVANPDPGGDRRRILWRDSSIVLIFAILGLLVSQSVFPPAGPVVNNSLQPTTVAGGQSDGPQLTLPPGVTFGPILDPSLAIDATPTPIPVITQRPYSSSSLEPSSSPHASVKPTVKPTVKPSGGPTAGPSGPPPTTPPTTPPTAPPSPVANFTWSEGLLCAVDFTNTSTDDTSWDWDFGDSTGSSSSSPTHTYGSAGTYSVTLTINGGADSVTKSVDVVGPCV